MNESMEFKLPEKPAGTGDAPEELVKRVEDVLERVRPGLRMDGGDVELIHVTADGVVQVRLQGACFGCPMATMTLHGWIEKELKANIPEVTRVQAV